MHSEAETAHHVYTLIQGNTIIHFRLDAYFDHFA